MAIHTCSIRDLKLFPNAQKLVIVRSLKHPIKDAQQITDLAPSWDLLMKYIHWRDEGVWDEEMFRTHYTPQFLYEMRNNPTSQQTLSNLVYASHTQDIVLACFCTDVKMCHRSIVATMLSSMNATMGILR